MSKLGKYILYTLMAISIVFVVAFFVNQDAVLDSFLYYAYILFGVALLAVICLPLINLFDNPKGIKKIISSLLVVVVLVGVSYLLSSGDPLTNKPNLNPTESVLKMTDTGLIMTYFLAAAAVLSIGVGGVLSIIRNR
ncbi:MAG: hypothetical protein AB9833_01135 [Bacteroidales bacterium]